MALSASLAANGIFGVCGGFPLVLSAAGDTLVDGCIPKGMTSVSATVQTFTGTSLVAGAQVANTPSTASVHLALYASPQTGGGADGAVAAQADVTGLSSSPQTLTVDVPSATTDVPATYVVRLWVDELTSTNGVILTAMSAT